MALSAGAAENNEGPSLNDCLRYDTKQSNGEALVMLEFGRMQGTPSLHPLLVSSGLDW